MKLVEKLFDLFLVQLEKLNWIVNQGKIIDASFIQVPKQRNTKADNDTIKGGDIPTSISEKPHRKAQKDTDARWVQKNNINYFGYKNHVKSDAKSKLITKCLVTDVSVHDSQATDKLLDEKKDKGETFYADSAYVGEPQKKNHSRKKND